MTKDEEIKKLKKELADMKAKEKHSRKLANDLANDAYYADQEKYRREAPRREFEAWVEQSNRGSHQK